MTAEVTAVVKRLAEDVLFPASLETDASPRVPSELLDQLAEAGLYGMSATPQVGGLGLERSTGEALLEILASGCLTTTFVLAQHLGTAATVSRLTGSLREEWGAPLAAGAVRSGIAFSHLRHPDPPTLTARPVSSGYLLEGSAPLVSGWGLIDVVHVAARTGGDVTWLLVDAHPAETLEVTPLKLAAVNASSTVSVRFARHFVPVERLTVVEPLAEWLARDAATLRTNGFLSLGVAKRALHLLGPSPLDGRLAEYRRLLIGAGEDELPAARATVSLFALHATAALVATGGGRSIVRTSHAQRLGREALFLLVQGQTRAVRTAQLDQINSVLIPLADRR